LGLKQPPAKPIIGKAEACKTSRRAAEALDSKQKLVAVAQFSKEY